MQESIRAPGSYMPEKHWNTLT